MERIPETIDVVAMAERIRPLAHQASESLRHTSDGLRQSVEHAREFIADHIDSDAPVVIVERPAAITLAARSLPIAARLRDLRRSPLQWLVVAIAAALVATLAAFTVAAVVRRLRARSGSAAEGPAIKRVEPVAIPISEATADVAADADKAAEQAEARVAEAG